MDSVEVEFSKMRPSPSDKEKWTINSYMYMHAKNTAANSSKAKADKRQFRFVMPPYLKHTYVFTSHLRST